MGSFSTRYVWGSPFGGKIAFKISQTSPLKLLFQHAEGRERAFAETVGPGNLTVYVSLKTNQPIQTATSDTTEI